MGEKTIIFPPIVKKDDGTWWKKDDKKKAPLFFSRPSRPTACGPIVREGAARGTMAAATIVTHFGTAPPCHNKTNKQTNKEKQKHTHNKKTRQEPNSAPCGRSRTSGDAPVPDRRPFAASFPALHCLPLPSQNKTKQKTKTKKADCHYPLGGAPSFVQASRRDGKRQAAERDDCLLLCPDKKQRKQNKKHNNTHWQIRRKRGRDPKAEGRGDNV